MDYVELRKEVIATGLLERQYGYYAFKIALTLAMLFLSFAFLLTVENAWLQLLSVFSIGFWLMQVGLLGHDAGHQAIFSSRKWNDVFGNFFLTFLIGLSYSYWVDRHGRHHSTPNDDDDPDFPVFTLTEKVMMQKKGIRKFIARRQHWLFLVYTGYFLFSLCLSGLIFLLRLRNGLAKTVEFLVLGAHTAVFIVGPFLLFPWWKALLMVLAVRVLWGIYFGSIVAVNHKGMEVAEGKNWSFEERQVLTTRDVRRGLLVDFIYGGLNYQIEHHLFPTMPRNNFNRCKPLVKRFCAENKLSYEELGVIASYRAILGELRRIALSAKRNKTSTTAANPLLSRSAN